MKKHAYISGFAALLMILAPVVGAEDFSSPAKRLVIIDADTKNILAEKDADTPFPPASMSKLMTVYMAFDAIRDDKLRLEDEVTVSDAAWRAWNNRGSTMFLSAGDKVTVADLLRGIIVLSGNDACVVLAEHMAGSHELFADWMNIKAGEIGLTGSHFKNANGWPADGHVMTARDLAHLSLRLSTEFPELYSFFAETEFLYKNYRSNRFNRNPLLGVFPGADGLKTGHTEESGYGLAASAVQDGRRIVLVAGGLASNAERSQESQRLMHYGFRNFANYRLFRAGETVDMAETWLGEEARVPLTITEDVYLSLSRRERAGMKVQVTYEGPIKTPIKKGDKLGALRISLPDRADISYDLSAGDDVAEVGGFGRIGAALEYLLFGPAPQ